VDADATRLAQVLGNLLGNAAKFTSRGGAVTVNVRHEGSRVALLVQDDGAGIAPEVCERLFQPFSQAPQTLDRTRGGLGLGLVTVKGLVELHGGSVAIASDGLGRGTEVSFRLPVAVGPDEAPRPVPEARSARRRVLVIEDNDDAASTLGAVLELCGHEVRVALDGPSGFAEAHAFFPDVVLCDLGLPGMTGYDVARALRADGALGKPLLVAMSGYAQPEDRQRALDAGFDRHVAKPTPLAKLEQVLAEARAAGGDTAFQ
jgi:two-component system CheB/CheR fusion protein